MVGCGYVTPQMQETKLVERQVTGRSRTAHLVVHNKPSVCLSSKLLLRYHNIA